MKKINIIFIALAQLCFFQNSFSQVGDNCNNAIQITNIPGNYSFLTDSTYADDYFSNCGGEGPDMVFQFDIPADSSLKFWVSSPSFDLVLSIIGDSCNGTEITCHDDPNTDTLYFFNNTPGQALSVWLIIDGYSDVDTGNGVLNWDYVSNPAGNTCDDAIVLTGSSGNYLYNTDSIGYTNSSPNTNCNADGYDLFLLIQDSIQPGYSIDISTTDDNYDLVVYMGTGDICQDNPTLICHDEDDSDTLSYSNYSSLAIGLWVVLDGYFPGGGEGNFHWNIHPAPTPNFGGTCDSAIVLSGLSGNYLYNTDSVGFYNTSQNTDCNQAGNDIFLSLQDSLQPGYSIDIWTTDDDYDVVIYMGTGNPCQDAPSLICHDDIDGEILTYHNLGASAQNLWVTVDGFDVGGGHANFHWNIYPSPPIGPGAYCDSALALSGTSGSYLYNTDSLGYTNSSPNTDCNRNGNDMYIVLDSLQPGYSVDIWTTDDDYDVVLYMGSGDVCQDSPSLLCHDDPDGEVLTYSNTDTLALGIWVILDSYNTGGGHANFHWNMYITPPPAEGSDCYNPIFLNDSAGSYAYNTDSNAFDNHDTLLTCDASGKNIHFLFSNLLNPGDTLTIWTTNDDYDVVLAAGFGSCLNNDPIIEVICHDDTDGDTLYLINDSAYAQTPWIMVDGYDENGSAVLNWLLTSTDSIITKTPQTGPKNAFKMWPNPSHGLITLQLGSLTSNVASAIEVRDVTSHVVYQNRISGSSYNLDLSSLSSGFYSVSIIQNGIRYSQSLILNK